MIPVYVLNLARSPERRAFMSAGLSRAGVAAEFIAAVDGRRCRAARLKLTPAETALILSHRKAWRRLLNSEAAHAVVLEDDVHLGEGFAGLLAADGLQLAFDAVKLETMFDRVWLARRATPFAGRALRRLGAEHLGAAGYLVSRAGARKLLQMTRTLSEPVDQTLFGRAAMFERRLDVHQLCPAIVVQDQLAPDTIARRLVSTLDPSRAAARPPKPRGPARLAREMARIAGQLRRVLRLAPHMRRAVVPWR